MRDGAFEMLPLRRGARVRAPRCPGSEREGGDPLLLTRPDRVRGGGGAALPPPYGNGPSVTWS
jgi:hypothetical protein